VDNEEDKLCTGVCMYDLDLEACVGCFRTLDEIEAWKDATSDEREKIKENIRIRKSQLN
jgi:predicted Fe-S protein YdhL (DUF1289 family)